jgi:hypothetical protein
VLEAAEKGKVLLEARYKGESLIRSKPDRLEAFAVFVQRAAMPILNSFLVLGRFSARGSACVRIQKRYGPRIQSSERFAAWRLISAGVVQWQNGSFPSCIRGFDSLHPLNSIAINDLPRFIHLEIHLVGIKVGIGTLLYPVAS